MSLVADVAALLTSISNVYKSGLPESPINAVGLYPSGGYPRSMTGTKVEEPTFMVKVRNDDPEVGLALCDTIKDLLHGASTTKLLAIFQEGDVLHLGPDNNGNEEWSINFRCYYRR